MAKTPDSELIETDREGYKAVEKAHRPRGRKLLITSPHIVKNIIFYLGS